MNGCLNKGDNILKEIDSGSNIRQERTRGLFQGFLIYGKISREVFRARRSLAFARFKAIRPFNRPRSWMPLRLSRISALIRGFSLKQATAANRGPDGIDLD